MQQLHFVLKDLEHAEAIQRDLLDNGLAERQLKFFSRDKNALSHLEVNAADFWDERDMPHLMMRGGMIALGLSVLAILAFNQVFPGISLMPFILMMVFLTMFGIWLGGLIGLNNENYKLADHHKDLLDGEAVLVINARQEQQKVIEKTMMVYNLDIDHTDRTDSTINPLSGWKLVRHPDD
ncbi:hypothetical protein L2725_19955 [Shewanella corallii]|uniref:DUF1269 domain-containing protein n=1 Tax=Shewanella corallii TaxID=560080 RepID=A0ABT0NC14_9GAMM|nr:hypothetical protein [Shewanella corallii]MCL2916018.1 hypothetical protein [Shewanella corallii]